MGFIERNINGILGTLIIHMIFVLIFLLIEVREKEQESMVPLDIIEEDAGVQEKIIQQQQLKIYGQEMMNNLSAEVKHNIAVNTANKISDQISTEKYIEQIKQDINFKEIPEDLLKNDNENVISNNEPQKQEVKEIKEFSGRTRISYNLDKPKRTGRHLPVPVYRCEGYGTIVLEIIVNQKGEVIGKSVIQANTNNDECLSETALEYAGKSLFNPDINAPSRQKGTLSYEFVGQQ